MARLSSQLPFHFFALNLGWVRLTLVGFIAMYDAVKANILRNKGLWAHEATTSNLSGLSIALFTHGLGWSTEELEVFLADVRKDMRNSKIHSYWPM